MEMGQKVVYYLIGKRGTQMVRQRILYMEDLRRNDHNPSPSKLSQITPLSAILQWNDWMHRVIRINIINSPIMESSHEHPPQAFHFFFFINTKSGNREGQLIMSYKTANLDQITNHPTMVEYTYIDLFDNDNRMSQIQNLKTTLQCPSIFVRIIICGGDGTISWVLNQLIKHEINMARCAFGVIPIGTGNDFCRTIGWPAQNFDFSIQNFRSQVKLWMHSRISKYDIWDVSIETYKNGKIYDIKDCKQYQRQENTFKKAFSNYVGLGLDARVVYTVQKIRTPYTLMNKILYALVGCLNILKPMKQLRKKLISFTQNSTDLTTVHRMQSTSTNWLQDDLKSTDNIEAQRRQSNVYSIKKKYRGFVCLNATSYMAGLRDMWDTGSTCISGDPKKQYTHQAYDDGKIEFIAYKNQLALALERCWRSGSKITQGSGPFEIVMRQAEQDEVTHMQIDGQSIKILNLKSIKINKSDSIQGHQINIITFSSA